MSEELKKDYSQSYKKMVETRRRRHGKDTFSEAGKKTTTHGFADPQVAKLAGLKRHHPHWFNDDGQLKPLYDRLLKEKERNNEG